MDVQVWNARRQVIIGLIALLVLFGGFGSWAALANISGAIISSGRVAVESNRQVVQHPDGGVVQELLVREGDRVVTDQPLLRLSAAGLASDRQIIADQLREMTARAARLEAERDETDLAFPEEVERLGRVDGQMAEILQGQRNLFEARREAMSGEMEQLTRRKGQIGNQIDGIVSQQGALNLQLGFLREELEDQTELLDRGLAQAPRVLALQREEARLLGQVGEFVSRVAELEGEATQMDLEGLKLRTRAREQAISDLRDLQFRRVEMVEQLRALEDRLSRLVVTAPVSGIVHDMQVFAERSVIRPADPVLYIVPQDRPLVIQTRVEPIHVDQVFPGQPVTLRLPAFDARTTPELFGTVVRLSPDALLDQATGASYYQAEVLPDEGEIVKLGDQVLLPGMPVEAYLRTEDRTPIGYLVKPLADYFNRAFREG
ncbi:HlyD family type I secretion periplasmic adaptor subunit [Jannaschia sp. KMU-145]|uniref:HlyD family type I secretion periplasmic adaptor subunit n=1 Tax=Jannaschia halovivens TaxID=3388667 RepID=UPI00396B436B